MKTPHPSGKSPFYGKQVHEAFPNISSSSYLYIVLCGLLLYHHDTDTLEDECYLNFLVYTGQLVVAGTY